MLFGGGKFVDGNNTNDAVYTTGDVGVGTTSPKGKLTVKDTGDFDPSTVALDEIVIGEINESNG